MTKKTKTIQRKVYTVLGFVPYESEDVLGIFTSKVAAVKAAKKIAARPLDYYADYTNYDNVAIYTANLNQPMERWSYSDDRLIWQSRKI